MSIVDSANNIIHAAIGDLRELAATALKQDNYDDLIRIARLADELSKLAGDTERASSVSAIVSNPPVAKASAPRRGSRRKYPRFERDGDKLVKIGWSKKSKKEYEHRAPYSVAGLLVGAIRNKVSDGELFTAADILPIKDVPDYQSYLVLKWLHTEGVVSKHGRDRYAIAQGQLSANTLDERWNLLPVNQITAQ